MKFANDNWNYEKYIMRSKSFHTLVSFDMAVLPLFVDVWSGMLERIKLLINKIIQLLHWRNKQNTDGIEFSELTFHTKVCKGLNEITHCDWVLIYI